MNNITHNIVEISVPLLIILVGLDVILVLRLVAYKEKINTSNIIIFVLTAIVALAAVKYYTPIKNMYNVSDIYSITILNKDWQTVATIKDTEEIEKIVQVLNKHSFRRSFSKSHSQQNVYDPASVMLNLHNMKNGEQSFLYILYSQKINLLQIGRECYDERDMKSLNQEVMNVLFELKLLKKEDYQ